MTNTNRAGAPWEPFHDPALTARKKIHDGEERSAGHPDPRNPYRVQWCRRGDAKVSELSFATRSEADYCFQKVMRDRAGKAPLTHLQVDEKVGGRWVDRSKFGVADELREDYMRTVLGKVSR